jgi:DUF4097 and DUF4098 domain-containing protein YvlB
MADNMNMSNITTVSGRVEIDNINANELIAQTTSGRIEIQNINADSIDLLTVSGHIETSRTQAKNIRTRTTSGRHVLCGTFYSINARSTSGRLEMTSTIVPESIVAEVTSGRIVVTVPNEDSISVRYSVTSGRFTSNIPVITHSADPQFRLTTTSGRITINALR